MERAILGNPELPGTVLRLPMIYGPGDHLHRLHPVLKRIDDGRRRILFEEGLAAWRAPRGYVDNVTAALALSAVSPQAAGRVLPKERMPAHLLQPGNSAQHWETDSTRIRRELGYCEPAPLDDAIHLTIDWERKHPPGEFNPHKFRLPRPRTPLRGIYNCVDGWRLHATPRTCRAIPSASGAG